ncbi:MAG: AmmeMemoRadiSam system protein B, partial [Defluviitaleaceae bacterium]|nr:AmmeMemoRadiSam system protein B [Defluviitaleaceae bacterium]
SLFGSEPREPNGLSPSLPRPQYAPQEPRHAILHVTHEDFLHSVENPRRYEIYGHIVAGVVPHHITAATMISGFFSAASEFADEYDLVIILAPNHEGDFANVILSERDWDIGEGVFAHRGFVDDLMAEHAINAAISHAHMESDHSAAILIPYIYHYLPDTKVAPILLNRSLNLDEIVNLFHWLENWIYATDENVLLVASVDFSHHLTPPEAARRDAVTKDAIYRRDFQQIHALSDYYLDSAAAMIIFLKYLEARDISPKIIDHACASDFLGPGLDETTTYMIIAGAQSRRVRLTFVGDIMFHEPQMAICFDHKFSLVREHLQSADLAIGNLETVFGGFFSDFPLFSAPDNFGCALRDAGFDLLSTANNHALDQGVDGLLRNLDFLESIGIESFGTYRNRQDRDAILIREVGGIRFAFLAYTFGTNNHPIPPGRDYLVNLIHADLIRADIARAREFADFVIIMPHMGFEYELYVRQEIRDWAMLMLEAGADIVVAGHPHVVQEMGFVEITDENARRGFVAYCLGNFISSQSEPHTYEGVMLNLYFERRGGAPVFADVSYVPTRVQPDFLILPVKPC